MHFFSWAGLFFFFVFSSIHFRPSICAPIPDLGGASSSLAGLTIRSPYISRQHVLERRASYDTYPRRSSVVFRRDTDHLDRRFDLFGKIREGFQNFGKKVKEGFQKVGQAFKHVGNKIKQGFQTVGHKIKEGAKKVGQAFKHVGNKIKEGVKKVGQAFKHVGNKIKQGVQKVGHALKHVGQKIKQGFQHVGGKIKQGFQKVGNFVKHAAGKVKEGFVKAGKWIKDNGAKVAKFGLKIVSAAANVASKVVKFIPGVGTAVGLGISAAGKAADIGANHIKADLDPKLQQGVNVLDKISHPVGSLVKGAGGKILDAIF